VITVATWNVLHRVHAEKYGEPVADHWPQEPARIAAVTAWLKGRSEQVIGLQEVSGDQLASLRAGLPERTVFAFRFPRVPVPHREDATALGDPGEYLVLLADQPGHEVAGFAFDRAPGKGALAVRLNEMIVIVTHVSGDVRRVGELKRLARLAGEWPDVPVVMLGDFNIGRFAVTSELGQDFAVAELPLGSRATRPDTHGVAPGFIDHVVVRGARATDAEVEDSGGLSDHNLVRATIVQAETPAAAELRRRTCPRSESTEVNRS